MMCAKLLFPLSTIHTFPLLLLPLPFLDDWAVLLLGGVGAFVLAYLLTFVVGAVSRKMGWLDKPEARRVHKNAVPRLGGVAMFLAFIIASLLFYSPGPKSLPSELVSYWLLVAAALLIVIVHAYDDVKGLKPWPKLLAQTIAVVIILGPGWKTVQGITSYVFHGVLLYGFSNPFAATVQHGGEPWYRQAILTLFIHNTDISFAAIPAVLFTWFWIAGMMNTVNLIDGLDGLATGVVAITGLFITVISWTLQQHSIAILAGIFTGSVLGFLPHNWNPAKIFMGDSGSQFLGLGLAVLSIMGGAKIALALMVLGIPILDVAVVMMNRVRRGQHPLHYDKTHLHYRLLATGLSVRQICYVFYGLTIAFGLLDLSLLRLAKLYKLVGIGLVGVAMIALIAWIDYQQRQRGEHIELGGPPAPPDGDGDAAPQDENDSDGDTALPKDKTDEVERSTPSEYDTQHV